MASGCRCVRPATCDQERAVNTARPRHGAVLRNERRVRWGMAGGALGLQDVESSLRMMEVWARAILS